MGLLCPLLSMSTFPCGLHRRYNQCPLGTISCVQALEEAWEPLTFTVDEVCIITRKVGRGPASTLHL